jgi:hypothetical protein
VFENRVLRIIFGPKSDEVTGKWRKFHSESFIICTHPQMSLGRSNKKNQGMDRRMGSEWILARLAGGVWNGFRWLRIGADGATELVVCLNIQLL